MVLWGAVILLKLSWKSYILTRNNQLSLVKSPENSTWERLLTTSDLTSNLFKNLNQNYCRNRHIVHHLYQNFWSLVSLPSKISGKNRRDCAEGSSWWIWKVLPQSTSRKPTWSNCQQAGMLGLACFQAWELISFMYTLWVLVISFFRVLL